MDHQNPSVTNPGRTERLVPSPAKNDEMIDLKHRQIVDGACRLFCRHGYHPTTIREIAEESGMSMGQLYHYISTKDDVLFLVYTHMQELWLNHLTTSRIDEIEAPLDRLTAALRHTLAFMVEHKDLFLFVYTETKYLEKRHLQAVLHMDDQNVVGFWRRLLEDVAPAGAPLADDIDFLANLVSFLLVFLVLRGWNLEEADQARHIDSLIQFTLRGLGVGPVATSAPERSIL